MFDVSVLFSTVVAARDAWRTMFGTESGACNISDGALNGLGELHEQPMAGWLDTRLAGASFDVGAAYIGVKLGIMSQYELRRMLTNPATGLGYPDPWKRDGLMRVASQRVDRLLFDGGSAVVLHKAGMVVKPRDRFRDELGAANAVDNKPYEAWLDITAAGEDDGSVLCRSHGMPHYFGAPDVHATVPDHAPSIERGMGAVRWVCAQIAAENASPFSIRNPCVPSFQVAEMTVPATEWQATYDDDGLRLVLTSQQLDAPPPARPPGWLRRLLRRN